MTFAMANPQTAFIDSLINGLYDNHPQAPIAVPKPEYFDRIDVDRALAIYKERFGDVTGMEFVFVGSIDEAVLKPLVETYIGSLPGFG
jgi:zinc protease